MSALREPPCHSGPYDMRCEARQEAEHPGEWMGHTCFPPEPSIHEWDERPESYQAYRDLVLRTILKQDVELRTAQPVYVSCGDCGRRCCLTRINSPVQVEYNPVLEAYKCFHCEVIFCRLCSRKHFGPPKKTPPIGRVTA